jgi:hypothetical protein
LPSSNIVLGGTSNYKETFIYLPSGNIVLGNSASYKETFVYLPSGNIVLGGISSYKEIFTYLPSFGGIFSNAVNVKTSYIYTVVFGNGILGGTAGIQFLPIYTVYNYIVEDGVISVSGGASAQYIPRHIMVLTIGTEIKVSKSVVLRIVEIETFNNSIFYKMNDGRIYQENELLSILSDQRNDLNLYIAELQKKLVSLQSITPLPDPNEVEIDVSEIYNYKELAKVSVTNARRAKALRTIQNSQNAIADLLRSS